MSLNFNLFRRSMPLFIVLVATGCADVADSDAVVETERSELTLLDLDGLERGVAPGAVVEAADGVRWDTEVDGEAFTVDVVLGATSDTIRVTGPAGRTLFEAEQAAEISYRGWVGDGVTPFERTVKRPEADASAGDHSEVRVGDALALPDHGAFFEPLSEARNSVAAPLALAVLPVVLRIAMGAASSDGPMGAPGESFGTLEQAIWPAIGVLVAAFGAGAGLGAAYCNRSSTTASCTDSEGITTSITCNACQGQAACGKVAAPSGGDIAIVVGADDDDEAYTCSCYCPAG